MRNDYWKKEKSKKYIELERRHLNKRENDLNNLLDFRLSTREENKTIKFIEEFEGQFQVEKEKKILESIEDGEIKKKNDRILQSKVFRRA